jgi:hypothetical protein
MLGRALCWLGWHQWIRQTREGDVFAECTRCKKRDGENWKSLTR